MHTSLGLTSKNSAADWHTMNADSVLADMNSSREGLSSAEAAERLEQLGRNELIDTAPIRPWVIFLHQFTSFIVWLLIIAGVISGVLGDLVDCVAILSIVVLNAIVGFFQEYSAEKSLAALKKMTAPQARIKRGGEVVAIPAAEVVPGDIVILDAGDLVPADGRLLDAHSLKATEAALTGESEPVEKSTRELEVADVALGDRTNMLYMGTSIATGSGQAVIVATGMRTEIGHIANLLSQAGAEHETPLQKRLEVLGRLLAYAALGIVALLFILGLLRQMEIFELFLSSVSLAVAAVPEGLPAVVTVALSLGVQRMARQRALIRKLAAVETLGSTNVICTDKTGTLTVGEMTVKSLYAGCENYDVTGEGYGPEGEVRRYGGAPDEQQRKVLREIFTVFVGCNDAHLSNENGVWSVIGDPTEGALLTAAQKAGFDRAALDRESPVAQTFPFDSERKLMTVVRKRPNGELIALVKGAPDVLLQRCTRILDTDGIRELTAADRHTLSVQNAEMAGSGLRVLAAGFRVVTSEQISGNAADVEQQLVFAGLAGMQDPPRAEARHAVGLCRKAGIRVVMITGDHPRTALAIAQQLGIAQLGDKVRSGQELNALSDEDLGRDVTNVAVFARVTAEHKLRIVRALQGTNAVVAMTGDGVNDAPAIKGADIGIAMGRTGTEVTKGASDMVITDDNFATIVSAVEQGRGIYDNIKKTLLYLLAGNTGELLLMTTCVILGLPLPLLPIHLLWINLVTDGLPALSLATDPIDPDVMSRPPRKRDEQFADRAFFMNMLLTGVLSAGVTFGVYVYGLNESGVDRARTYAFMTLVFEELLRSFAYRSQTKIVWQVGIFTNLKLVLVVVGSILFQAWAQHNDTLRAFFKTEPQSFETAVVLFGIALIPISVLELIKLVGQWRRKAA